MLKSILTLSLAIGVKSVQIQPVYTLPNLPVISELGQSGTNFCTVDSQSSQCQNAYINSVEDFCLWGPPEPNSVIGDTERIEVAWCTKAGHGTRLIPQGAITAAHYVETPQYIQITGMGDLTNLNILAGDAGGELDPHGADGNGNPIGGLVFSTALGNNQVAEWTSFISSDEFCFRICKPSDSAYLWCQHIYDLQGCYWNEPGNYLPGFDTCAGDTTVSPPGIYIMNGTTSTYQQGDGSTPAPLAHAAGATSNCVSGTAPGVIGVLKTISAPTTTGTSTSTGSRLSTLSSLSSTSTSTSSTSRSSTTSTTSSTFRTSTTSSTTPSAASAITSPSPSSGASATGVSAGVMGFLAAIVALLA